MLWPALTCMTCLKISSACRCYSLALRCLDFKLLWGPRPLKVRCEITCGLSAALISCRSQLQYGLLFTQTFQILKQSCLATQVLYCAGPAIEALVTTGAHHYLEFKLISGKTLIRSIPAGMSCVPSQPLTNETPVLQ